MTGVGWSRRFELARVRLGTVEASVASAGRTVAFAPSWREAAPPPPPAPKAETPIVARLVYPMTGYEISADEKARWPNHGWAHTPEQVIAAVEGNKSLGRTEIVVAFGPMGESPAPKSPKSKRGYSLHISPSSLSSSPPSKGYCPPREASAPKKQ